MFLYNEGFARSETLTDADLQSCSPIFCIAIKESGFYLTVNFSV